MTECVAGFSRSSAKRPLDVGTIGGRYALDWEYIERVDKGLELLIVPWTEGVVYVGDGGKTFFAERWKAARGRGRSTGMNNGTGICALL